MRSIRPPVIRVGQTLGRYRIEGLLGRGGMGQVYLARDTSLRHTVAIKVVDPDRQNRSGLIREARLAAALDHPSICAVHEIGQLGGEPYIVMEHVKGTPLATVIRGRRAVPIETALWYERQIADAVAHAHDRGIVHGDLKSSNVMIAANGRVKVLDFGLAVRRVSPDEASLAETDTPCQSPSSACAGTVPYMAPELLRGHAPDELSDIWALGVMLHEMLVGCRPFRGATAYELAAHILADERVPVSGRVPDAVSHIIDCCLSAIPPDRYLSARALSAAIRDIEGKTTVMEKGVGLTV
jgi:serine/threonine protein kinase